MVGSGDRLYTSYGGTQPGGSSRTRGLCRKRGLLLEAIASHEEEEILARLRHRDTYSLLVLAVAAGDTKQCNL